MWPSTGFQRLMRRLAAVRAVGPVSWTRQRQTGNLGRGRHQHVIGDSEENGQHVLSTWRGRCFWPWSAAALLPDPSSSPRAQGKSRQKLANG
jgi:hypothetical protein